MPVVLEVVVSLVGYQQPESLWHQLDVITPVRLRQAVFEMLVMCKPKARPAYHTHLSHSPALSEWLGVTIAGNL